METYRYGFAWRALGVTVVFIAAVFPILLASNHEAAGLHSILTCLGVALAGLWCLAYFTKYKVTLAADGFTVDRLGRRPVTVVWREVVAAHINKERIAFTTARGGKIAVSAQFPGYDAIEAAADKHLSDVAFGAAGRPLVFRPVTQRQQQAQHLANRREWRRLSRRACVIGAVVFLTGLAADLLLAHVNFKSVPRAIATASFAVLTTLEVFGYAMGVLFAIFAVLFALMGLQEAKRARTIRR